jgi:hypothetical protein
MQEMDRWDRNYILEILKKALPWCGALMNETSAMVALNNI